MVFVQNDCPEGRIFAPFELGVCPAGGGMVLDEVDSCMINAISALAKKCIVNGTNRLFPEDDTALPKTEVY